jgi:bacillithiol synthase
MLETARTRTMDPARRELLAHVLFDQYSTLERTERAATQIESLRSERTFAVTTGHQVCLATGPLYVIYKIVSAIALARKFNEAQPEMHAVPVFWLATEDHDIAEISSVMIQGQRVTWPVNHAGAVCDLPLDGLRETMESVAALLPQGAMREEIAALLAGSLLSRDYVGSFRALIHTLFGEEGLVMIDGQDHRLKASFAGHMRRELFDEVAMRAVSSANSALEQLGYSPQVNPRPVNLFYLADGMRRRIGRAADGSFELVDGGLSFSIEEIEAMLTTSPEVFSPNVVMRPVYQEWVLPGIAAVGGPGEISYWLQLMPLFGEMEVPFPVLVLRDSFLILQSRVLQRLHKIGLSEYDVFRNRAELIRSLADTAGLTELAEEREMLRSVFESVAEKARLIDPTLDAAARAEGQKQQAALEHFSKRLLKAAKAREEQRITQLERLFGELFPDGGLQERHDNYFDHAARAGKWFHTDLIRRADPFDYRLKPVKFT